MDTQLIQAISEILSTLLWPLIFLLLLLLYRKRIGEILANIKSITFPGGTTVRFNNEYRAIQEKALSVKFSEEELSQDDIDLARNTQARLGKFDSQLISNKIEELGQLYIHNRAIYKGTERTRRANEMLSQLRAIALLAKPLLPSLLRTNFPGDTLASIAILQVNPNPVYIDFLGRVASEDMTYIGHQATVTLLQYSKRFTALEIRKQIKSQVDKIQSVLKEEKKRHHRAKLLPIILRNIAKS